MKKTTTVTYTLMLIYYRYRILILVLTFITYMFYTMARRPLTVVKTKFINCPEPDDVSTIGYESVRKKYWKAKSYKDMYSSLYNVKELTSFTFSKECFIWMDRK